MQASLDLEYGRTIAFFTWENFDEMTEIRCTGSIELNDDSSIKIDFAYHLGD